MRKIIISIAAALLLSMSVSAEFVNTESGLNLRAQTTIKSTILALMPYGAEVEVSRTIGVGADIWADVDYNGIHGYAKKEWLSPDNPLGEMEYCGEWTITAYAYTGSRCANGNFPTVGYTVACNSLPFGTKVYIDGVGFRTVEDNDGGQMGNEWIDLYLGDTASCIQWGMQNKKVWRAKDE